MKLGTLSLKNFLSYDKAEIDFSNIKKALIIGTNNGDPTDSNGAGKTNIFEAIGWCHWGESKAETVDLNVKHGKDECAVKHVFEHDGKQVSITRTRNVKTGTSTVDFLIDGIVSNGATATDTNKEIQKFLNLDYNTFMNSVYIKQDDVNSIANAKSSEARDLLEKVLNLDEYERYYENAKDTIKLLEDDKLAAENYIAQNSNISGLKDALISDNAKLKISIAADEKEVKVSNKSLEDLNKKLNAESHSKVQLDFLTAAKVKAEEDLSNLTDQNADLRNKAVKFKKDMDDKKAAIETEIAKEGPLMDERNVLRGNIDTVKAQLAKIAEIEDVVKDLNTIIDVHNVALQGILGERNLLAYKRKQIQTEKKQQEDKLSNPTVKAGEVCPDCLTPIEQENIAHYQEHLKDKIAANDALLKDLLKEEAALTQRQNTEENAKQALEEKINTHNEEIQTIKDSTPTIESIKSSIALIEKDLLNINALKKQLDDTASQTELDSWKATIKSKKTEIDNKTAEIEKLSSDIEAISINSDLINQLKADISTAAEAIHLLNIRIIEKKTTIKNNDASVISFDIILSEIENKQTRIADINKDLSVYIELANAFSSKGIRAYILENAIVELEKEANEILYRLSNGRLSVEFRTKKEVKKKGEKQDKLTFEVLINDGQKTFPFGSYSGGEKFRISFVLRVALSKLLLRRAHSKLEFLIIDEAVSPLDSAGVEKVMEIINDLQEDFKTILVITHRNDVKSYFDEVITVNKTNTGSTVEITN